MKLKYCKKIHKNREEFSGWPEYSPLSNHEFIYTCSVPSACYENQSGLQTFFVEPEEDNKQQIHNIGNKKIIVELELKKC